MRRIYLLFTLFIVSFPLVGQTIIWSENFDNQVGKGVWGDGSGGIVTDLIDINWTLDYSNCTFENEQSFIKVDKYRRGGRFEAHRCNGEAIWESEAINISDYEGISVELKIGETGSSNNQSAKYIKVYSVVDGVEALFSSNGERFGNFGSATATTNIAMGNTLKIRIKVRSDFAQDVYFDSIVVKGSIVETTLDKDSEILSSNNPLPNQTITSIDISSKLQEVFKFKITDKGTGDGKPTKLTKVVLKQGAGNTLDWGQELAEVVLKKGTESILGMVVSEEIIFNIPEDIFTIADNSSEEFSLCIKTKTNVADGTVFQAKISENHHFEASGAGSSFLVSLPQKITSAYTTIDVVATQLAFGVQPTSTKVNKIISPAITVEAVDSNGNLDKDFTKDITLSATDISGTTTVTAVGGVSSFSAIKFTDLATDVRLIAQSGTFPLVESNAFGIIDFISENSEIRPATASNTEVIEPNEVAEVLSFIIEDKGGDNYPTKVSQLVIVPNTENELAWRSALQTAYLSINGEVVGSTANISDIGIVFAIPEGSLSVEDGQSVVVILSVQLAKTVEEGKLLGFQIPSSEHQAETFSAKSSRFIAYFPANNISNSIKTEVVCTKLIVIEQPKQEKAGTPVSIPLKVEMRDEYGNLDKNNPATATLLLVGGTGTLHSAIGLVESAINGTFKWTDFSYNRAEVIRLQIALGDLHTMTEEIRFSIPKSTLIVQGTRIITNDTILSSRDMEAKAKGFMTFAIQDQGDDGLPTLIEKIRFTRGTEISQSRIYYLVGGILIKKDDVIIGKITNLNRANGYTSVEVPINPPLSIADGERVELTASLYLSQHSKLVEGEKVELQIAKEHGCVANAAGTGLVPNLPNDVTSSVVTVDVVATRLKFENIPQNIEPNYPFEVSVLAINEKGKLDKDYSGIVTLSRESGTGILSSTDGLILHFTQGIAKWTGLTYDKGESFTLLATSPDFSPVESRAINANDTDSELLAAEVPIKTGIISSTSTSVLNAKEVFRFAVQDKGTYDEKPTILTRLSFKNNVRNNTASWKQNIAGAVLYQGTEQIAVTDDISDKEIIFEATKGVATIADGTTAEFTLGIFLNYNNIEDNKLFQCYIDAVKTNFNTSGVGSGLRPLLRDIVSEPAKIEVTATQLDFLTVPYVLASTTDKFRVRVGARDMNGNIDTDINQEVALSDANLLGTTYFVSGVATFDDIKQSSNTDFTLNATSGRLNSAQQDVVLSRKQFLLFDDFENASLTDWISSTDWQSSQLNPISGSRSLKHTLINAIGSSHIAYRLGNLDLNRGTTVWRWQLKNGDWTPSSSNNFYYSLVSTQADLEEGTRYGVGVERGLLTLWKLQNNVRTTIIETPMRWKSREVVGIEVKRNNKGEWTLSYDNNGGFDNLYTGGTSLDYSSLEGDLYTGVVFNYGSASRAGQLWGDDISVYHFNTAPLVDSLKVVSATSIEIYFNQEMRKKEAEDITNFEILPTKKIYKAALEAAKLTLTIDPLTTNNYVLNIKKIYSFEDVLMADTSLNFSYMENARVGDIVLNELMIDETPPVKLPESEYIELFNTTNRPIALNEWSVSIGKEEVKIPNFVIEPNEYIILTSVGGVASLKSYGRTIGVVSLPALTNSGNTVTLKNTQGETMDQVTYTSTWYNDEIKKRGGWSLERINPDELNNTRANWTASQAPNGGTPGEKNSVYGIVLDDEVPQILTVVPISRNELKITFSEPIDTLAISEKNLFEVSNIGHPSEIIISKNSENLNLIFDKKFAYGSTYTLRIKELVDLFGNTLMNAERSFSLPEIALFNDLVINEILFNPVSGNVDYVELYNRSGKTFELSKLSIATRDSKGKLQSVNTLSVESHLFTPNTFIVLTKDAELVAEQYEIKNPKAMLTMKRLPNFPNEKGIVVILNQEKEVVDEFHYNENMHSKLLVSKQGVSLERINYELPTQNVDNWHSASASVGYGTPSYENSAYSSLEAENTSFLLKPKMFSPNGDGIDDEMKLHYSFKESGKIANVTVFDSKGRLVIQLKRNESLGTKGMITWNGVNAQGLLSRTGRYLLLIELFDEGGNIEIIKETVVLYGLRK